VLSEFTIALFEDSGWYKANYTALHEVNEHPLQWGKGKEHSVTVKDYLNTTIQVLLCTL